MKKTQYQREYMRKWRENNPDKKYEKSYQDRREYNEKNKVKISKRKSEYYKENKEYFKGKANEWYQKNKENKAKEWKEKRLKVLTHLGGECVCCKERQIEFLAIDHINNDGHLHRKTNKINIYDWLMRNNYPDGVQILCHNCNLAKSFYGICPHKKV